MSERCPMLSFLTLAPTPSAHSGLEMGLQNVQNLVEHQGKPRIGENQSRVDSGLGQRISCKRLVGCRFPEQDEAEDPGWGRVGSRDQFLNEQVETQS